MKMEGPYWVYTHTCPNGMVYVGMSSRKDNTLRWQPNKYKTTSLQPYIEEFGWENIEHFFIDGINTKESALKLEDDLIKMYSEMGCCINKNNSGGFTKDKKEYRKQYCFNHKNEIKEKLKQYYQKHKEELREKNKQYREENKEHIKEYKKRYQEEHKEELKEYKKEYYLKNKK